MIFFCASAELRFDGFYRIRKIALIADHDQPISFGKIFHPYAVFLTSLDHNADLPRDIYIMRMKNNLLRKSLLQFLGDPTAVVTRITAAAKLDISGFHYSLIPAIFLASSFFISMLPCLAIMIR